jgi:hypothetical protein
MDLDDLIASAVPRTKTVRLCGRGDLASEHEQLYAQLEQLALSPNRSLAGDPEATAVAERIHDLEAEMESVSLDVKVKALSRNAWSKLLRAHPPTTEQRRANEDHNPETFAVAAVAACIGQTEDKTSELADTLPNGEWLKLWNAVVQLNVAPTTVPKLAAATELLRANGRSSTTSDPGESPAARSLGGSGDPSPDTPTTTTDD